MQSVTSLIGHGFGNTLPTTDLWGPTWGCWAVGIAMPQPPGIALLRATLLGHDQYPNPVLAQPSGSFPIFEDHHR